MSQPERSEENFLDNIYDKAKAQLEARKAAGLPKTTNLDDFDQLWDVSFDEALDFVEKKDKGSTGIGSDNFLLKQELKQKEFEIQKFKWQLSEREKELKRLYEEVDQIMHLNQRLNTQLELYSYLEDECSELRKIGKFVATKLKTANETNIQLQADLSECQSQKGNNVFKGIFR